MVMFSVDRYVSMSKVGMNRGVIEQRISVDLQVPNDQAAIISFVDEIVDGKENNFTQEIIDQLESLAQNKYQRLEAKGVKSEQITIIKYQDQPNSVDVRYNYDPPAVLVAFDDEHADQIRKY